MTQLIVLVLAVVFSVWALTGQPKNPIMAIYFLLTIAANGFLIYRQPSWWLVSGLTILLCTAAAVRTVKH